MTATDTDTTTDDFGGTIEVRWDLDPLVDGRGADGVSSLLDRADALAAELTERHRGGMADLDAAGMATLMERREELADLMGRAGNYVQLRYATKTDDPERGAAVQAFRERAAQVQAQLVWVHLEWLALDDADADVLIAAPELERWSHELRRSRAAKPHVQSEPVEQALTGTSVTGRSSWVRLHGELTSAIEVDIDGKTQPLEAGLSRLAHPDREVRRAASDAVTAGLEPTLRTRAFAHNVVMADGARDARLRGYPTWISSWNLQNEASDEAVDALVEAVVGRYDIAQRWYSLKARLIGVDKITEYDRAAPLAADDTEIRWDEACALVRDAYQSFSPELAGIVGRFLDEGWIDAPPQSGKRGGAFCAYTVPGHHPYVFLNWTSRRRDVMTLAHELGHGVHGYLARDVGSFNQSTPLTVAETASVFGETVTFERLLDQTSEPEARLSLWASTVEDHIATVFRQIAMNRFEDATHRHRWEIGELSVDDFNRHWVDTQAQMFGDSVEITDNYKTWWSYIPHFIGTPGYVYAYAFGKLLALSVYARFVETGPGFVADYLDMLRAGSSRSPQELAAMVGCDLTDPGFWGAGLDLVSGHVDEAEAAARAAGKID